MKDATAYEIGLILEKINEIIDKLVEKGVITEGEIEKLEE